MDKGYILLNKSIIGFGWYKEPHTAKLFIHLLLLASETKEKSNGVNIEKGQVITSVNTLSIDTGLSISKVQTALKHLELTNDISIETTNMYSKITICNYDYFCGEKK